jgi:hypothetical protein
VNFRSKINAVDGTPLQLKCACDALLHPSVENHFPSGGEALSWSTGVPNMMEGPADHSGNEATHVLVDELLICLGPPSPSSVSAFHP